MKHTIFVFFLFILLSCNRYNNKIEINDSEKKDNNIQLNYVQPQEVIFYIKINGHSFSMNKIIERSELWDLSQNELRILRNAIFAKYGLNFNSEDLQIYFSQFSWYEAKYDNVDNYLSEMDMENINRIQQSEHNLNGILIFQNKILAWIKSEEISSSNIVSINGIKLYQNPILYSKTPEKLTVSIEMDPDVFSDFITNICFAMGQFLSINESNEMLQNINNSEINEAIIFNPSVLFLNEQMFTRVYRPFHETGVYLIVFPKDNSSSYKIQVNQVINNCANNILILPWSITYYVYKINIDGSLLLVDTVVAN